MERERDPGRGFRNEIVDEKGLAGKKKTNKIEKQNDRTYEKKGNSFYQSMSPLHDPIRKWEGCSNSLGKPGSLCLRAFIQFIYLISPFRITLQIILSTR